MASSTPAGPSGNLFLLHSYSLLSAYGAWLRASAFWRWQRWQPFFRHGCCAGDKRLAHAPAEQAAADSGLKQQIALAFRNPSYLLLHAGFLTCGFHVAFLTTHLPSEAALCGHDASVPAISLSLIGLCNIAGSIAAGFLGKHYPMKYILAVLYASRAVMIALFLLSSKSETAFYVFACAIGFTACDGTANRWDHR